MKRIDWFPIMMRIDWFPIDWFPVVVILFIALLIGLAWGGVEAAINGKSSLAKAFGIFIILFVVCFIITCIDIL